MEPSLLVTPDGSSVTNVQRELSHGENDSRWKQTIIIFQGSTVFLTIWSQIRSIPLGKFEMEQTRESARPAFEKKDRVICCYWLSKAVEKVPFNPFGSQGWNMALFFRGMGKIALF